MLGQRSTNLGVRIGYTSSSCASSGFLIILFAGLIAFNNGSSITFKNISFQRGRSQLPDEAGGITIVNSAATFYHCSFLVNNNLHTAGGDFTGDGSGGALNIFNVAQDEPANVHTTVQLFNSTFNFNQATRHGGAMVIGFGANVTISGCSFTGNSVAVPLLHKTVLGG